MRAIRKVGNAGAVSPADRYPIPSGDAIGQAVGDPDRDTCGRAEANGDENGDAGPYAHPDEAHRRLDYGGHGIVMQYRGRTYRRLHITAGIEQLPEAQGETDRRTERHGDEMGEVAADADLNPYRRHTKKPATPLNSLAHGRPLR